MGFSSTRNSLVFNSSNYVLKTLSDGGISCSIVRLEKPNRAFGMRFLIMVESSDKKSLIDLKSSPDFTYNNISQEFDIVWYVKNN